MEINIFCRGVNAFAKPVKSMQKYEVDELCIDCVLKQANSFQNSNMDCANIDSDLYSIISSHKNFFCVYPSSEISFADLERLSNTQSVVREDIHITAARAVQGIDPAILSIARSAMIDNSNTTDSRAVEGIDSELFNILQTETAYNNKSDNKVICPNKRPNVIHIGLQHEFSKIIEANRERIISYIYPTDNYLFNIKGTNDLLVLENKLELPVEEKQIIVNFDALVEKYCNNI